MKKEDLAVSLRCISTDIVKELNAATNRIQRWLQIYFPAFLKVYSKFSAESALLVLEEVPYPADILALGAEGVKQIWREHKLRAVGMKRAKKNGPRF